MRKVSYHTLLTLKDSVISSGLTDKRSRLADEFLKAIQAFQAELPEGLSKAELKVKLQELDTIISNFQIKNETLSFSHHKDKSSGRLADKMQSFKEQVQTLKSDGEDDRLESGIADGMKRVQ